jgi:hypothetical protein
VDRPVEAGRTPLAEQSASSHDSVVSGLQLNRANQSILGVIDMQLTVSRNLVFALNNGAGRPLLD